MGMRAWGAEVRTALAALALVAAACGGANGGSSQESPGGTIEISGERANDHGTADISGTSTFELQMGDLGPATAPFFSPTVLTGTPGQMVELTLENEGATPHNFTLEDQGIDQDVDAGQEGSVTLTFPESSFLEFHCKFHSAQGMRGELKVA